MEKVKITQELESAIEILRDQYPDDVIIDKHCLKQKHRHLWSKAFDVLNDTKMSVLSRSLHVGYEVEPKFKVGDWIAYDKNCGEVIVLRITDEDDLTFTLDGGYGRKSKGIFPRYYRHATPQEIATEKTLRWWTKHDRDVWELKRYDNLSRNSGSSSYTVWKTNDDGVIFNEFGISKGWDEVKKEFRVSCFIEGRKDI